MEADINLDEMYANERQPDKTDFAKSFSNDFSSFKKKYAHKILDYQGNEFLMKDEVTLGHSTNGLRQLKALFLLDETRSIEKLILQQFGTTRKPIKNAPKESSFTGQEIEKLYLFLKSIKEVSFPHDSTFNIKDDNLESLLLDENQANKVVRENLDIIQHALNNNVTTKDIINFGYRKNQLDIFEKLIKDNSFLLKYKNENNITKQGEEVVWQFFFEKNSWILGYGLDYVFNSELDNNKLEQVTSGFTFNSKGKRIDAFLKSRGAINSLCFCELKLNSDPLLKHIKHAYRGESWQISDELAGAIAQVQRTVQNALKEISSKTEIKDEEDNLTGETVFLYSPKTFVIIGNLKEFVIENKINETKYASFEMFRKSLKNIEIITYDELFERAFYICHKKE
ncbi:hypothetical protein SF1_21780 [Sphingobacterium faecium NBRC 15299]|uniref:Shedu immune nuclease family protein n=1 Tax=Sphingobacterium faecium TaxID=34087 RepID=UPI000D3C6A4E|nr:Shedu immune nuclease family protein [Sphingobacterium faecium]PTX14116.1 uncharacterized protein DUF4263 [Sphingobacterium faecium]GEM64196.1 hypothetical protein SF1_21780 [Sphingobacterium faecium NBRC 15299]